MPGHCKSFNEFEVEYGEAACAEIMTRIEEEMWKRGSISIEINSLHTINAANHIASGCIKWMGELFNFQFESGDYNGSLMRAWGKTSEVGIYEPPAPTEYTFTLKSGYSPAEEKEFLKLKETEWFKKKIKDMNYDFWALPGLFTTEYYKKIAASHGLKIDILRTEDL